MTLEAKMEINWEDAEVMAEYLDRARVGLRSVGEFIMEEANKTVPLEEGDLSASSATKVTGRHLGELKVRMGYTSPYALIQHEDTEMKHDGIGRAKWFQLTLQEQFGELLFKLGRKMSR